MNKKEKPSFVDTVYEVALGSAGLKAVAKGNVVTADILEGNKSVRNYDYQQAGQYWIVIGQN